MTPRAYNNARKRVSTESITINGESRVLEPSATLLDLVRSLGLEPERVAIELNRAIVKREQWPETRPAAGAQIEIVQFVGGG